MEYSYEFKDMPDSKSDLMIVERSDGEVRFTTTHYYERDKAKGLSDEAIWDGALTEEECEAAEDNYFFEQTPFGLVFVTPQGVHEAHFDDNGRPVVPGING